MGVRMTRSFGSQSMVGTLRKVVVRRPDSAFSGADPDKWHYTSQPNGEKACAEHDAFVEIVRSAGAEAIYLDGSYPDLADSIYVHDPSLMTDEGAILLCMGKPLRRDEVDAHEILYKKLNIPIYNRLHGDAIAEGGDLMWLDEKTLAAGVGFRTNYQGIMQLQDALKPLGVKVIPVELPYYHGPEACLHLMSFISMVDHDLAVVYPPLMPVPFWQELEARGIRMVEVPEEEFVTMGPNVLALAPGKCLMIGGNPKTQAELEKAGCTVQTYSGNEISLKAEGGATCLTRPILREY